MCVCLYIYIYPKSCNLQLIDSLSLLFIGFTSSPNTVYVRKIWRKCIIQILVYYRNEVLYFAQIEDLTAKLAVKTKATCQKCLKFKRQVKSKLLNTLLITDTLRPILPSNKTLGRSNTVVSNQTGEEQKHFSFIY